MDLRQRRFGPHPTAQDWRDASKAEIEQALATDVVHRNPKLYAGYEDDAVKFVRNTMGPTKWDLLLAAESFGLAPAGTYLYPDERKGEGRSHAPRTLAHAVLGETFGRGPGSGTHAASHAQDADPASSTGTSHAFSVASTMRDSMASMSHPTSAIKAYDDGSYSFQHIQPEMYKDKRGSLYRSKEEPGARKAADRGQLETIPKKLVSRHFDRRGTMTVTDHSKGAKGTHPDEIRASGGTIRDVQPRKR